MIRGCSSSNRLWKKFFFFIFGNWARDPIDVNNAPFLPFTSVLGRLRPEGMSFFLSLCLFYLILSSSNPLLYCCNYYSTTLDKLHLEHIDRAFAYPERSFHSLVTFRHLVFWGLGPKPTEENLAHKETTSRSKCHLLQFIFFLYTYIYIINSISSPSQG